MKSDGGCRGRHSSRSRLRGLLFVSETEVAKRYPPCSRRPPCALGCYNNARVSPSRLCGFVVERVSKLALPAVSKARQPPRWMITVPTSPLYAPSQHSGTHAWLSLNCSITVLVLVGYITPFRESVRPFFLRSWLHNRLARGTGSVPRCRRHVMLGRRFVFRTSYLTTAYAMFVSLSATSRTSLRLAAAAYLSLCCVLERSTPCSCTEYT